MKGSALCDGAGEMERSICITHYAISVPKVAARRTESRGRLVWETNPPRSSCAFDDLSCSEQLKLCTAYRAYPAILRSDKLSLEEVHAEGDRDVPRSTELIAVKVHPARFNERFLLT